MKKLVQASKEPGTTLYPSTPGTAIGRRRDLEAFVLRDDTRRGVPDTAIGNFAAGDAGIGLPPQQKALVWNAGATDRLSLNLSYSVGHKIACHNRGSDTVALEALLWPVVILHALLRPRWLETRTLLGAVRSSWLAKLLTTLRSDKTQNLRFLTISDEKGVEWPQSRSVIPV